MTSDKVLSQWAQDGQFLPPVRSVLQSAPFQAAKLKPFVSHLDEPGVKVTGLTPSNTALLTSLQDAIESAMSGSSSPQGALNKAAAEWNQKLADGS